MATVDMKLHVSLMIESEVERLDLLADLFAHWKRWRDRGYVPRAVREAIRITMKEAVDAGKPLESVLDIAREQPRRYATTRANCRAVGVDVAITPEPPEEGARLVAASVVGQTELIYWWELPPVPDPRPQPPNPNP